MFSFNHNTGFSHSSDEELMRFISKGKKSAFNELYKRYDKKLHYYFYRMLHQDNIKAQDFLQELFLKIIEKPNLFDTDKKFSTWIYSIASNMCKNEYRKDAIRGTIINLKDELELVQKEDESSDYDKELFKKHLKKELSKLDDEHKETFILRYQEELAIKEISQIMNCSEGTVKSRIFYTTKKLAVKLRTFNPHKSKYHGKNTG
ncbi:MAG: RNA polymerase sigma factor [Bacteroidia bacterium]|nr:RNA polymerase sigma factor [Bacteroidia bacterium]